MRLCQTGGRKLERWQRISTASWALDVGGSGFESQFLDFETGGC